MKPFAASPSIKPRVNELTVLFEISQLLDKSMDLREVVRPVLQSLAQHMDMQHGTISLLNRKTDEIVTESAYGLSESQLQRGRYRPGEGVTGKVVQTGQPAIVPKISEEPLFLNRTGVRKNLHKKDISFLCVPIKLDNAAIGALSVDRLFSDRVSFEEDIRLLSIIASMIAQAVRLRQSAMETQERLQQENTRLQEELKDRFRPSNIIGNSKAMQLVYDQISQVCKSNTTVLIRGESGTGKELVAAAIHYNSTRANMPFIRVNSAALPETVVESELFGHEKGAFTGALSSRQGRFELAHGGTLFLDEVGDLSPTTQIKLLRVIQEREFERVGGSKTIKTDVRILAATNRNLEDMVKEGSFRQDLYYRLNVFPIHIPPLRDRKNDILVLADYFVEKYNRLHRKAIQRISTPAIDMLMAYHWPGNVRELENCMERAVLVSEDEVIHGHYLPPTLQTAEASGTAHSGTLQQSIDNLERELILDALKSSRGNMAQAARSLGITERIMGLRIRKHSIQPGRFKL